jgi:hypothetical protein
MVRVHTRQMEHRWRAIPPACRLPVAWSACPSSGGLTEPVRVAQRPGSRRRFAMVDDVLLCRCVCAATCACLAPLHSLSLHVPLVCPALLPVCCRVSAVLLAPVLATILSLVYLCAPDCAATISLVVCSLLSSLSARLPLHPSVCWVLPHCCCFDVLGLTDCRRRLRRRI